MANLNWIWSLSQEALPSDWVAEGHAAPIDWLHWTGTLVYAVIFVGLAWRVVRAFQRQARYQAKDLLSDADLEELKLEIVAAESRTVGEILPVVVERSDAHPKALWLSSLVFVILGSTFVSGELPIDQPVIVLVAQLCMGLFGYCLAYYLPDFARLFVSESRASEMAQEQAFQEFYRHGLHKTEAQTGVLIFVSLFEHRVVVLADEGINAKVSEDQWQETDLAILGEIAKGSLKQGLSAGILSAAGVLEEHFPWVDGDRNEIPDRIIVRRE